MSSNEDPVQPKLKKKKKKNLFVAQLKVAHSKRQKDPTQKFRADVW